MTNRDPDGVRLPIRIDSTSNGEFEPVAIDRRNEMANSLAQEWATENAKRKGVKRRDFMVSACGAASTLLAINHANAMASKKGAKFDVATEAGLDEDAALESLAGDEFIFDIQGHYVNPEGAWLLETPQRASGLATLPNGCVQAATGTDEKLQCLRSEEFVKDVFLDSDTDMMVLSFVPSTREAEPLTIEEADETRRIVDAMEGDHRLLLHGRVNPNQDGDLEDMDRLASEFEIAAWKTYTQWGPGEVGGFYMTDDYGEQMIAKARELNVKNIAIHKGLAFGPQSFEHSLCSDIGEAAKRHPDINFILYHSGLDIPTKEEAFTPGEGKDRGMDVLCQSLIDAGVGPNSNVYAELGSTWRFLMRDPEQAAHALGKLIQYCGEDNVLWGTDSIWYGSPQDQIQAFRTFEISDEFQDQYGYAAMTKKLKAKIFGLNATKPYNISLDEVRKRASNDGLAKRKHAYLERPDPSFTTYGPKTRREFFNFKAQEG